MTGPFHDALKALLLGVGYFLLALLGLQLAVVHEHASLVWPASGLAVACLVLGGQRLLPGVVLGSFAANMASGLAWEPALMIACGNTLEAFVAAWLLLRPDTFDRRLKRLRDVVWLVFPVALGATIVAASIGTLSLLIFGLVPVERVASVWLAWWGGEAQGVLLVTPLVLGWAARWRPDHRLAETLAAAAFVALILLFTALTLEVRLGTAATQFLISFALFPLAIWPAVRFPMREVATFNFVVAALCILATAGGLGPFVGRADPVNLFGLHGLLSTVALTTLMLCAISTERREAAARLRESEARFRSLTELSADWYWEQDRDLRFTQLSASFLGNSPFDVGDYIGKRRWEAPFLYRDSPEWAAHRRQVEAHQPFRDFLLVRQDADGELHYSVTSGEPVFDEHGAFAGYRGVGRFITEQKRAEIALAESRELFARIFETSAHPMLLRRFDGTVTAVNDAWCEMFGRAREQVVGRSVHELDLMIDPAALRRIADQIERTGAVRDLEVRVRARDGEVRDVLYSAAVVDIHGERCVIATSVDVTERRRAEEQVKASNARLALMFRGTPQPIAISGLDDARILDVNDAWCRTYGYAREDLGGSFLELGLWVDPTARRQMREQLLATGSVRDFECRWRRKSGEIADVLLAGELMDLSGERVILSTALDVTERKRAELRLRESESRFATIFHSSPVALVISSIEDGALVDVNEAWLRFFGYSREEVAGANAYDLGLWASPTDRAVLVQMLRTREPIRGAEARLRKKSGELADALIWSEVIELSHAPCMLTSVMDITERKLAERQLRESERRFRDFADAAGEYVWELDVDGRFVYVSRRVEQVLGYAPEELYGRRPIDLMPVGEQERAREWYAGVARRREPFRNAEHRSLTRSGSQVWQLVNGVPIIDVEGRLTGYRGTALDITERKQAEVRIAELATRDPLTSLPNRLLLNDRLAQGLTSAQRSGEMLALMFIDLDHFKSINDELGHDVGDALLKEVAKQIGGVLRKGDTLSRLGGDEFVVVLEGLKSADDAGQVAQKIINSLAEPCDVAGQTLATSCSIGIAVHPGDGADASTLMRHADTAMYVAKSTGRKNYQFFSADMNVRANERARLETCLREAVQRDELRVFYQPRVDLATGTLTGAEALLRWQHPEQGLLSASQFLSVVEETGLIHAIGGWVLEHACTQTQAWHALYGPNFSITVNVSGRQFTRALIARVHVALESSGLDPRMLELDVTEPVLAHSPEESSNVLAGLRKLGLRVVVDDFGTGYSSMSELRRFAVDGIKIDRSFVRGMLDNPDDRIVVKAMIDMARSLRINTIAEGVESEQQLDMLRTMGCEEYAGHLLAEPVPAAEFERRCLRTDNVVVALKPRR